MYTAFEAEGGLWQFTRVPFGLSNSVPAFQRVINTIISNNNLKFTFAYLDDVLVCGSSQEEHDSNLENFKKIAQDYNLTLNESKFQYSLAEISYLGYSISGRSLRPDPERLRLLLDLPVPFDSLTLLRSSVCLVSCHTIQHGYPIIRVASLLL